jgi:hypothetical protein
MSSDVTKCTGRKYEEQGVIICPFKDKCARFFSPREPWQWYFVGTPLKLEADGSHSCEFGPESARREPTRNTSQYPEWVFYAAGACLVIVRVDPGEPRPFGARLWRGRV